MFIVFLDCRYILSAPIAPNMRLNNEFRILASFLHNHCIPFFLKLDQANGSNYRALHKIYFEIKPRGANREISIIKISITGIASISAVVNIL